MREQERYKSRIYCKKIEKAGGNAKEIITKLDILNEMGEESLINAQKYLKENKMEEAEKEFYYAALCGKSAGFYNAGKIRENGDMGYRDYQKAREYYKEGDAVGNISCYEALGDLYYKGMGVPKNLDKAIEYYEKAGNCGREYSMKQLVTIYNYNRRIFDWHLEKFIFWAKKYVEKGHSLEHAEIAYEIAIYYKEHPKEEEAENLQKKYYQQSANDGYEKAILDVVELYCENDEEKKTWLYKAHPAKNSIANYRLALLLIQGDDEEKREAFVRLEASAHAGYNVAIHTLGLKLIKENKIEKALSMLLTNEDYAPSCRLAKVFYREGTYVEKNEENAIKYMYLAAIGEDSEFTDMDEALRYIKEHPEFDKDASKKMKICECLRNNFGNLGALRAVVEIKEFWNDDRYENFVYLCFMSATKYLVERGEFSLDFLNMFWNHDDKDATYLKRFYLGDLARKGNIDAAYVYGMASLDKNKHEGLFDYETAYNCLLLASENEHVEAQYQLGRFMLLARREIDWDHVKIQYRHKLQEIKEIYDNCVYDEHEEEIDEMFQRQKEEWEKNEGSVVEIVHQYTFLVMSKSDVIGIAKIRNKWYETNRKAIRVEYGSEGRGLAHEYLSLVVPYYSYAEAVVWLKKAAEAGHVEAMSLLGMCYVEGIGVSYYSKKICIEEGMQWLKKAADLGDTEANSYLKEHR